MRDLSQQRFQVTRLAIFGVGLIGGSLAMALKQQKRVTHIIGVDRSRDNLELALRRGVIDEIADNPVHAAEQADVIVLATPVNAIPALLKAICPALTQNKVITDVGSVKAAVCDAASTILGDQISRFVPGHPIAGKEHSGVQAATADLFENHNVVLTPSAHTDADALQLVQDMWCAAGATISTMQAEQHDRVLALTSHLPHILAYAMVDLFASSAELADAYDMAAGGFYDFSRTASSDPEMWRDICLLNRTQILQHIEQFKARLTGISSLIEKADGDALESIFAVTKKARSQVVERRKQHLKACG